MISCVYLYPCAWQRKQREQKKTPQLPYHPRYPYRPRSSSTAPSYPTSYAGTAAKPASKTSTATSKKLYDNLPSRSSPNPSPSILRYLDHILQKPLHLRGTILLPDSIHTCSTGSSNGVLPISGAVYLLIPSSSSPLSLQNSSLFNPRPH